MNKRPLSPHLSVYRLPLSANMSILHRITGATMFGCLSFLCWYFIFKTFYSHSCECFAKVAYLAGVVGSFTFFYHISTGIRHLVWDAGYFLSKEYFVSSAVVCMMFSALLVAWFWIL